MRQRTMNRLTRDRSKLLQALQDIEGGDSGYADEHEQQVLAADIMHRLSQISDLMANRNASSTGRYFVHLSPRSRPSLKE